MERGNPRYWLTLLVMALIPAYFLAGNLSDLALEAEQNDNSIIHVNLDTLVREKLPFTLALEQLGLDLRLLSGQREQNGIFISEAGLMRNVDPPIASMVRHNTAGIEQFARRMARDGGKRVYLAIIPTAVGVLQQNLPRFAEGQIINQQRQIEQMYNALPQEVSAVDVYSSLYSRRGQYIYYRTDNSLTALGGYYAYTAMATRMEASVIPLSRFDIEYVDHDFYGDLYRMPSGTVGEWEGATAPYRGTPPDILSLFRYSGNREYLVRQTDSSGEKVYHTLYPKHRAHIGAELDIYLGGRAAVTHITASGSDGGQRSLLVLGDKTAAAYLPFLVNNYRRVTLVDFSYATAGDLEAIAAGDYDQILFAYGIESYMHTRTPARVLELN